MSIQDVKGFVLKALLAGEPVWFAADAGAENDKKDGIFALGMYDYRSLLGVNMDLTKAERILYFDSSPNHAMVFVGADTLGGEGREMARRELVGDRYRRQGLLDDVRRLVRPVRLRRDRQQELRSRRTFSRFSRRSPRCSPRGIRCARCSDRRYPMKRSLVFNAAAALALLALLRDASRGAAPPRRGRACRSG